jgi:hypothetical protein
VTVSPARPKSGVRRQFGLPKTRNGEPGGSPLTSSVGRHDAEGVAGGRAPQERCENGVYLTLILLCPVESYKILRALRLQFPSTPAFW